MSNIWQSFLNGLKYVATSREQLLGLLRDALKILGVIAAMVGIAVNLIDTYTAVVLEVGGGILTIVGLLWSMYERTHAQLVAKTSAIPEIKKLATSSPQLAEAAKSGDPNTEVELMYE